jgi:uncharacterized protein (TIRG00374 family)
VARRALVSTILGLGISAACLVYAFYGVNLSGLLADMRRAEAFWIVASIASALLSLVFRAIRWKVLLLPIKQLPAWSLISATFIGMMANNVLPARIGEVVKAWVLARREHTSMSTVLGTVLIERLFDVMAALVILGISLALASDLPTGSEVLLKRVGFVILIAVMVAIAVLLFVLHRRERSFLIARRWTGNRPGANRIAQVLSDFVEGLSVLRGQALVLVSVLSMAVWAVAIGSFYALAEGMGLGLTTIQTTLVFVIVLFGVAIPSAPGFVGTFHGFCVAALTMIAQTEPTLAAAYATLIHGLQWIAVNLVGAGFLLADRTVGFASLKSLAREAPG